MKNDTTSPGYIDTLHWFESLTTEHRPTISRGGDRWIAALDSESMGYVTVMSETILGAMQQLRNKVADTRPRIAS